MERRMEPFASSPSSGSRRSLTGIGGRGGASLAPGRGVPACALRPPAAAPFTARATAQQRWDPGMALLCGFAVANPLIVQAYFYLLPETTIAGLSIPQLFQGSAFLAAALICLARGWKPMALSTSLGRLAGLVGAASLLFLVRASLLRDRLTSGEGILVDVLFSSKIVFWASAWWFLSIAVRREQDARRLLIAVVAGALLGALVVIGCYVFDAGSISPYVQAGVKASAGATGVSGKQTASYLAIALIAAVYLGRRRRPWTSLAVALTLLTAVLLTYDRTAQVALAAAAFWLLLWRVLLSNRRTTRQWSTRLLVLGGLSAILLFSWVGFESLYIRWTSDFQKGQAGSGRLLMYQGAWNEYVHSSPTEILLGVGYTGVREAMIRQLKVKIHTHSDFFDLLLCGGIVGILLYLAIWHAVWLHFRKLSVGCAEYAAMGAMVAVYAVTSLITGQLEATHAMFCLGAGLQSCRVMGGAETPLSAWVGPGPAPQAVHAPLVRRNK